MLYKKKNYFLNYVFVFSLDAAILARLEVFDTDIPDETIAKDTGEFTLEKALKLAKTYHAYANDAFKHKNISTAINKYALYYNANPIFVVFLSL